MNERDALNAALRALNEIDKLLQEKAYVDDPQTACEDVADITGDVIGELARAGYQS